MSAAAGIVLLLGRVLFSVFFARSGIGHMRKHQMMGDYSRAASFPAPYLAGWPAGVWLLAASLSIGLGIWPDLGSLMVAVFVVPAGLYFHRFWTLEDPAQRQTQSGSFFRNVVTTCLQPSADARERGFDDPLPHQLDVDVPEPSGPNVGFDLGRGRHGAGLQPPHAKLRETGDDLPGPVWNPHGRDVGHHEHAARTQHPCGFLEEAPPRREVEGRLYADQPVHRLIGQGDPRGVTGHRVSAGSVEVRASGAELRLGDVERNESRRPCDLGDEHVLDPEAVPDVEDDSACRKPAGQVAHEAPHRHRGFFLVAVSLPEPEVQPPGSEGQEEV